MKPGVDYIGVGVGAFIFNDTNAFLMMKRGAHAKNEAGSWMLPGGAVEFGETLQQAIIREVKEEFDIDIVVDKQFITVNHILPDEHQHWVAVHFLTRIQNGTAKILEPDRCDEIRWVTLDNLPSPIAVVNRESIAALIKRN
jgi:mutator protein MutT